MTGRGNHSRAPLEPSIQQLSGAAGLERELTLRLPSDLMMVDAAVALVAESLAERFTDSHSIRFNVRVALCEALANAILYGNGNDASKTVHLLARYGRASLEIHVTDEGEGFDPDAVPDPTLPENLLRTDGRGVFLIRRLMDEVRYNEKGNSLCMILRRDG